MNTPHTGQIRPELKVHALADDGSTLCGNAPVIATGRRDVTCGACLNSPRLKP
jgi:hypothetical protein